MALIAGQFQLSPDEGFTGISGLFMKISLFSGILVAMVAGIYFAGRILQRNRSRRYGPTWGCGYTAGNARQQYTSTSFAANFTELADPLLRSEDRYNPITGEEIFPGERTFERHPQDLFSKWLNRFAGLNMLVLKKLARLQTGNIRHYILYAFIFILVIFMLLYLGVI
jgi:hypothetical protein